MAAGMQLQAFRFEPHLIARLPASRRAAAGASRITRARFASASCARPSESARSTRVLRACGPGAWGCGQFEVRIEIAHERVRLRRIARTPRGPIDRPQVNDLVRRKQIPRLDRHARAPTPRSSCRARLRQPSSFDSTTRRDRHAPDAVRRGDHEQIEIGGALGVEVREAARQRDHAHERHVRDKRQDAAIAIEQLAAQRFAARPRGDEIGSARPGNRAVAMLDRRLQQIALAPPATSIVAASARDANQARFELRRASADSRRATRRRPSAGRRAPVRASAS